MAKKHHRTSLPCDNTKMPEELTSELMRRISQLRPSLKSDYLKQEVFSSFFSDDSDPPEVRRTRAINKWLATERDNEATNDRLILTHPDYQILPGVSFESFIIFCQNLVATIIGDTAPVSSLIGGFSGGASTSRNRTLSHPALKYLGTAHVTPRCLELFDSLRDEMPGWLGEDDTIKPICVVGNVMFTVPKKTDIDRCACKEPDLNMFIQKGIGNHFRDSLSHIGINLRDQSINRSFAQSGSYTGSLATYDLSSASDSICTELVQLLLPECWYTLLDSVRSHVTIIDGEEHLNHMFSSMGNGFTFELESLLFYTLTRAISYFTGTRGDISVYGDDIICPVQLDFWLPSVFRYFGFTINGDKSFVSGPFRESCGGHYHLGVDITPFYVKAPIKLLSDVIRVANQLRAWGSTEFSRIIDPEVEGIWVWLVSFIPKRLWGGDNLSSITQLVAYATSSHVLVESTKKYDNGLGGYYHWLNATWDRVRLRDAVLTSSRSVNLGRFRARRTRLATVPQLSHYFIHEIV